MQWAGPTLEFDDSAGCGLSAYFFPPRSASDPYLPLVPLRLYTQTCIRNLYHRKLHYIVSGQIYCKFGTYCSTDWLRCPACISSAHTSSNHVNFKRCEFGAAGRLNRRLSRKRADTVNISNNSQHASDPIFIILVVSNYYCSSSRSLGN
jgi:hypothetical protein